MQEGAPESTGLVLAAYYQDKVTALDLVKEDAIRNASKPTVMEIPPLPEEREKLLQEALKPVKNYRDLLKQFIPVNARTLYIHTNSEQWRVIERHDEVKDCLYESLADYMGEMYEKAPSRLAGLKRIGWDEIHPGHALALYNCGNATPWLLEKVVPTGGCPTREFIARQAIYKVFFEC